MEDTSKYISLGFKGKKHSEATRKKIRETKLKNPIRYWLGKKRQDMKGNQWNKNRPSWNKGKHWTDDFKEKVRKSVKKLWEDRKYRDRMVAIHLARTKGKMELHYNWKGGKSFEPYPKVFNNTLKRIVKEIDGYICKLCDVK